MTKKAEAIEMKPIDIKKARITIVGDGSLILNKMNARTIRDLANKQFGRAKDTREANTWEDLITAINWRDPLPTEDTYSDCDEEMLRNLLINNAPCISAFGLKEALVTANSQLEIGLIGTRLKASVNFPAPNNLIPISFTQHEIAEKLIPTKQMGRVGAPVVSRQHVFDGWSATFYMTYMSNIYSLEQIANVLSGVGLAYGIGSARTSGYGRFHIESVTAS